VTVAETLDFFVKDIPASGLNGGSDDYSFKEEGITSMG
jgi:hypothetical protein